MATDVAARGLDVKGTLIAAGSEEKQESEGEMCYEFPRCVTGGKLRARSADLR